MRVARTNAKMMGTIHITNTTAWNPWRICFIQSGEGLILPTRAYIRVTTAKRAKNMIPNAIKPTQVPLLSSSSSGSGRMLAWVRRLWLTKTEIRPADMANVAALNVSKSKVQPETTYRMSPQEEPAGVDSQGELLPRPKLKVFRLPFSLRSIHSICLHYRWRKCIGRLAARQSFCKGHPVPPCGLSPFELKAGGLFPG